MMETVDRPMQIAKLGDYFAPPASQALIANMRIFLEVTTGSNAGHRVLLQPYDTCTVGRATSCGIVVTDDALVSGVHFAISHNGGLCRLRDERSTNGTFLNGRRVADEQLQHGDEIIAGQTRFVVHVESATNSPLAAIPAPPPVQHLAANHVELVVGTQPNVADPLDILDVNNDSPFSLATMLWEVVPGQAFLTVVLKATFSLNARSEAVLADTQLPIYDADHLEDPDDPTAPIRFESDIVPIKPRADIIMVGRACAPDRRIVRQLDVQLRVGNVAKKVRVFGDRKWSFPTGLAVAPRIRDPEPFREMELTYRRAFGGIDAAAALYCHENLAGAGFIGARTPESIHDRPLPNLEDPEQLINDWDSRPTPVSYGFYGRGWSPRLKLTGAYDDHYYKQRAPLPPEDFSYAFYNGAHPGLQAEGYLQGGESVEIRNMHSDGPLSFQLPYLRPRLVVTKYRTAAEPVSTGMSENITPAELKTDRHVHPVLDTLVLIPNQKMFYEVFRSVIPIADLDNINIKSIQVAAEQLGRS
jgi:pSer/pThr/pTyr-binding forkhead associated (FHA) protein